MDIGLIGLGNMGLAIGARLIDAGHELTVYNRTPSKAKELLARGATMAHDPAGAAQGDVVITLLSDDVAVEHVFFGASDSTDGLVFLCIRGRRQFMFR